MVDNIQVGETYRVTVTSKGSVADGFGRLKGNHVHIEGDVTIGEVNTVRITEESGGYYLAEPAHENNPMSPLGNHDGRGTRNDLLNGHQ